MAELPKVVKKVKKPLPVKKPIPKPIPKPDPEPKEPMIQDYVPAIKLMDGTGEKWDKWISKFITCGWQKKRLPAGDFYFPSYSGHTVGIETKSVQDLTSDIERARKEFATLIDSVDIPIFLVWGNWNRRQNDALALSFTSRQITWSQIWNMLMTFQNEGLRIEVCLHRDHTFQRINQLYTYYQEPEHRSALVARRSDADRRVASLMPIPGVSKVLATSLLKEFKSFRRLAAASQEDLRDVPLIGKRKAEIIEDYMSREAPYR